MRRALPLILAAVALLAAPAAAACPRTTLGDVEDEVMCPVCGTPLNLAEEAPQAERERAFIQREIDRCRSKGQIKEALVAQYGDRVLALPGDQGDSRSLGDVLVYVVPALAILLAAAAVAVGASRWRRRRRRALAAGPSVASDRLDADMDRYDL